MTIAMSPVDVIIDTDGACAARVDLLRQALSTRGLTIDLCDVASAPDQKIAGSRVVAFVPENGVVGRTRERLTGYAGRLIDIGASVALFASADECGRYNRFLSELGFPIYANSESTSGSRPRFHALFNPDHVANIALVARRSPLAGEIVPAVVTGADALLLRRSFHDAISIRLSSVAQGHTSTVYRIDAVGTRGPMRPFLAKFTNYEEAAKELELYQRFVHDFVPFSFRPSLIPERCSFGHKRGLLVSQFIEGEESLANIALRYPLPSAFHNIFENLLSGWWRQGVARQEDSPVLANIRHWYEVRGNAERFSALCKHAVEARDPKRSVEGAISRLSSLPATKHKEGVIHGDLHANNIRVRGGEVFLIDFGSTKLGPLVADPAMLEASLVVEAGIRCCVTQDEFDAWREFAGRLFVSPYRVFEHRELHEPVGCLGRLGEAIRTIRLHALAVQSSDCEYEQALLAAYVRLASYCGETERSRVLRALYSLVETAVTRLVP